MTNTPLFIFLARPTKDARIVGIFDGGRVRELLERPPTLRSAGWSLETLDQARIVRGEYLEVSLADNKRIQIYEDGTTIARVRADNDFLGWGTPDAQKQGKKIRINPLALMEFCYLCVEFYRRLMESISPVPDRHELHASFRDAREGEDGLYLNPFGVDTWAWTLNDRKYLAPESSVDISLEVPHVLLVGHPAQAAYQLVEKIYLWFGLPTTEIPYTAVSDTGKAIDVDMLRRGGKQLGP